MMAIFHDLLNAGANVTTPLGLVGFTVACVVIAYAYSLRQKQKLMEGMPKARRAAYVDDILVRLKLSAENLSEKQAHDLIQSELQRRFVYAIALLIVASIVFLTCFIVSVTAYRARPNGSSTALPPIESPQVHAGESVNASLPARFEATDLGISVSDRETVAFSFAGDGVAVGRSQFSPDNSILFAPVLFRDGLIDSLPTAGGIEGWAEAANSVGDVTGYCRDAAGRRAACVWHAGEVKLLGNPTDKCGDASAINSAGDVVGQASLDKGTESSHAFLYRQGKMLDLTPDDFIESAATGINDQGHIVGWSRTKSEAKQIGFLLTSGPGGKTKIDILSPDESGLQQVTPAAINQNDWVVGHAVVYWDTGEMHAFLFKPGIGSTDLGTLPGGDDSYAWSINSTGWIVGESAVDKRLARISPVFENQPLHHAFISDGKKMVDLNDLVPESRPQWEFECAMSVNNRGEVLAQGWTQYSRSNAPVVHAFLLRPVHSVQG
jgi:probable HAF family extracellular repeat protein